MQEDRSSEVLAVAVLFLVSTWIFVLLRIYTRCFIVKTFGPDDYLAVFAQAFFTVYCSFSILGTEYGTGRHTQDIIPASNIPIALQWWWCCEPAYVIANCCIKLSIGIFLLRIAFERHERYTLYLVMGTSMLVGVLYFWLFIFQCWPPQYFWERYLDGAQGKCLNTDVITKSTYVFSAVCCLSDWAFCILPCIMIVPLQMNIRTKISVVCLLGMSAITSIATIVRFPYLSGLSSETDFLYETTDVAIWSTAETGLAITTCCAATLRPLIRNFLARSRLFHNSTEDTPPQEPDQPLDLPAPWRKSRDPERVGYSRSGITHVKTTSTSRSCPSLQRLDSEIQPQQDLKSAEFGIATSICDDGAEISIKQPDDTRTQSKKSHSTGRFRHDEKVETDAEGSASQWKIPWSQAGITNTTEVDTSRM